MVLVFLALGIIITVLGVVLYFIDVLDEEMAFFLGFLPGGIITLVSIIATIILGVQVSKLNVIDDKIAMYQEENTRIEEQVATVVQGYQEHEKDIFKDVSPESSMTLVVLYPELKSDTLVQSQIEVYTANNEKIKDLKEQKINGDVKRWWLYFGG